MSFHESVSKDFVTELCESYLDQSAWANAAEGKERELRRVAAALPYSRAVERAEYEWTKPQIETELNIRLVMGSLMMSAPGSVTFTEGY